MIWGDLMREVCAGTNVEVCELPRRALGGALRDYCRRTAKVQVALRLGSPRYHDYYEVRPARRRGRAGFGVQELARLREVLGPYVPYLNHVFWADPFERHIPEGAGDGLYVPIVVPPEHEDLARDLMRQLVERFRPGTFPEADIRMREKERAKAWLARHTKRLRECAEMLGQETVLQALRR